MPSRINWKACLSASGAGSSARKDLFHSPSIFSLMGIRAAILIWHGVTASRPAYYARTASPGMDAGSRSFATDLGSNLLPAKFAKRRLCGVGALKFQCDLDLCRRNEKNGSRHRKHGKPGRLRDITKVRSLLNAHSAAPMRTNWNSGRGDREGPSPHLVLDPRGIQGGNHPGHGLLKLRRWTF